MTEYKRGLKVLLYNKEENTLISAMKRIAKRPDMVLEYRENVATRPKLPGSPLCVVKKLDEALEFIATNLTDEARDGLIKVYNCLYTPFDEFKEYRVPLYGDYYDKDFFIPLTTFAKEVTITDEYNPDLITLLFAGTRNDD